MFAVILLSKVFHWNEQHLQCLETKRSEIFKALLNICNENESRNNTHKVQAGVKNASSLLHQAENYSGSTKEPDAEKIKRLESELKLALEEYDRVLKLLEEQMRKSTATFK